MLTQVSPSASNQSKKKIQSLIRHCTTYNTNVAFKSPFLKVIGDFRCFEHWLLILLASVQLSHSVLPRSLWPPGLQHTRPPCPSPTPGTYSNSCPSSQWWHPAISSSVISFSSHLQSFPASGSFPMSQFFTSGDQSIGVSASTSVLPMKLQGLFPLGWTGFISFQSKGLLRVFNTTVQKQQFFSVQLSL